MNNWVSVRKAFLDLDHDYDGFITAEDIARHFAREDKKLDFNVLRQLMVKKDSKKVGKISYRDFSKWMGSTIEPPEGFCFRHDSSKNPEFDRNEEN